MSEADDCTDKLLQTIPPFMRMLGVSMRRASHEDQLSLGHMYMLEALYHHPRNLRELAKHHHVTSSTMSRSVDLLVKRSLVERRSNPDDRREIELRLTEAGLAAYTSMSSYTQEFVHQLVEQLDQHDRMQLLQGLDIIQKMMAGTAHCCMPQERPEE